MTQPLDREQPQQLLQGADRQLVDLVGEVLVDPNVHTDLRMRLREEIATILDGAHPHASVHDRPRAHPHRAVAGDRDLAGLLAAVLVDPNLHTDQRMRLHREVGELLGRTNWKEQR